MCLCLFNYLWLNRHVFPECCSVLQCLAVCCSVLQCLAVCCSVLQYVMAVWIGTYFPYVLWPCAAILRDEDYDTHKNTYYMLLYTCIHTHKNTFLHTYIRTHKNIHPNVGFKTYTYIKTRTWMYAQNFQGTPKYMRQFCDQMLL